MTTENGVEKVKYARQNIEKLRHRVDFLVGKIVWMSQNDKDPHFEVAEVRALEWALPILEAEWDNLVRIRRNMQRAEQQLRGHERHHGEDVDIASPPTRWEEATV